MLLTFPMVTPLPATESILTTKDLEHSTTLLLAILIVNDSVVVPAVIMIVLVPPA